MLRNKLMTACSVAVLTAALYGCSSSSDDGPNMQVQDLQDQIAALEAALEEGQELTPETIAALVSDLATAEADLETANGMVMDLETMIGDEMDPAAESLRGMLAQANMDLDEANAALLLAMDNTADDLVIAGLRQDVIDAEGMRDSYMTMLETANDELDGIGGAEGLRAKVARLEGEVAGLKQEKEDEDAADTAKMASGKAAEVLKALDTPSGTAPAITLKASSDGDFTAEAATYTMSDTAPDAISGFRGAILTKDRSEAHVYTTIEDAAATPIRRLYRFASDPAELTVHYDVRDALLNTGEKDILWSETKRNDTAEAAVGVGDDRITTFAGSVRGLPGTFSCMGTACVVPVRDSDGAVTTNTPGPWTFTPTNPSGTIDVVDKDGYLQFGWWLNQKGRRVENGFNVDTFAIASAGYLDSAGDARGALEGTLEGSATYTGGAAGKWAIASTTEDRTDGGHFTATATLGVDFDVDANPADDEGNDKTWVTVSGMITEFMTGDVSRPDWSVELILDATPDDPDDASTLGVQGAPSHTPMITGTRATWDTGGAVDGTGDWEATFHGTEKDTEHPLAVVGTFNAAIAENDAGVAVGRIQGAFGATK